MIFNIVEFSKYRVSRDGILYNKYNRSIRRKWVGDNIYVQILDNFNNVRTVRLDKLVYQTYVQNPPYEYDLEHIDGNQANCNVENLFFKKIDK